MAALQRGVFASFISVCALLVALSSQAGAPEVPPDTRLARLVHQIEPAPLAYFAARDLRALPDKFVKTFLYQMLQDPSYVAGRETLKTILNQKIGADVPALWPDFSGQLSGPVVLALVPVSSDDKSAPPFALTLYPLVASPEAAAKLRQSWPKLAPQNPALLAYTQIKPVVETDLPPAADTIPKQPASDLHVVLRPHATSTALRGWLEKGNEGVAMENLAVILSEMHDDAVDTLSLAITMNGEYFEEELNVTLSQPPDKSSLARVASVLREQPEAWASLRAATPGEQDASLMLQTDLAALGEDAQYLGQSYERDMRGRRWMRTTGRAPEALAPDRYTELFKRFQGSFTLVAKPALSGDIRVTVLAAMKGPADADMLREDLKSELSKFGADFDTLANARKIGASSPLGAKFKGQGLFGSPVIGISPGWAWLCSNLATYQDLTNAFKARKTLAAEAWKDDDFPWQPQDSARLRVQLERVLKIAYAAWLLSGEAGPYIGPWKIPGDLLPQPQVFTNRLGQFHGTLYREGNRVSARTRSAFFGMPYLMFAGLIELANGMDHAKVFTRGAREDLEQQKELRNNIDALDAKEPKVENGAKENPPAPK